MGSKKCAILVLDDEELVRDNLTAFCEDEGFTVFEAASGEEAIELVKAKKISIGIIDMRLPGIDGNMFILRAYEINPDIKYIIHTGSSTYSIPQELLDLGITDDDVIRKPILDMNSLKEMINRAIKG
jgi:CheY-like chemotaxis protein